MTTATARFSSTTMRLQAGTAAVAIAAAAAFTPTLAHATPNVSQFTEGVGSAVSSLVDPVINPFAAPSAAADPCVTANFSLGCYAVEGLVAGTQAIVRGVVVYIGTAAYVVVAATGEILKFVGTILPGPLGDFFTNVGDGVSAFAVTISETLHVGPYQTAQ